MPAGLEVTVPAPVPAFETLSAKVFKVKVAVTLCADDIVTTQLPVPVQAPDQPVKSESAEAVGVRVTRVPWVKDAEHVAPQATPPGEEVTVPVPVPAFETVSA